MSLTAGPKGVGLPNQQRKVLLVEQGNIRDSVSRNSGNFIRSDVDHWKQGQATLLAIWKHLHPTRMNASAINAVDDSAARFRIMLNGSTMTSCAAISHFVAMNVLQLVTASTKAWRFSATKMVYAEAEVRPILSSTRVDVPATNPICDNAIEVKITDRILGP